MNIPIEKEAHIYDVIGIGFGPANISLAAGFEEIWPDAKILFLEKNNGPSWQADMRLFGSDIQNHPLRDLVTPRNPQSYYSFTNFLHKKGRLFEHLNLGRIFPYRIEYEQYVQWVAEHFRHQVRYETSANDIKADADGHFEIRTNRNDIFKARSIVVAPGRTPYIPDVFSDVIGKSCTHLTNYLSAIGNLKREADDLRVAVIGGSQSAVELLLDLSDRIPKAELHGFKRTYGYRMKDVGPFTGEVYFPEFVDHFFDASEQTRKSLQDDLRLTNYSASDADILDRLYQKIYQQKTVGQSQFHIHRRSEILKAENDGQRVNITFDTLENNQPQTLRFDLVLLATGFKDLGPEAHQEKMPSLLNGIADQLDLDASGCLQINKDYSVNTSCNIEGQVFLNGLCENSHGMGDAGSFSLLSLRAQTIIQSLQKPESNRQHSGEIFHDFTSGA